MKYLISTVLFFFIAACSSDKMFKPAPNTPVAVAQALEQAVKSKDFRLYGSSGRRMVLPGITAAQRKTALALCGYKLMSGSGDVIKKEQQRVELKKKFAFMAEYNRQMLRICQKNGTT